MKIFISADIEGVAGVVSVLQGNPGNPEYERARRLMTEEVNAAIAGAFDGGATEVVVADSHGPKTNLLADELDPRAEQIQGQPRPNSMVSTVDSSFAAAFFTGYHSGAGRHGVLAHTVSGFAYAGIRLNGIDCAEATLNGAFAGSHGVPVVLLTGDDQLQAQCAPHFPGARFVVVKQALGARAARTVSPATARSDIRAAAAQAVRRVASVPPFIIPGPYRLELDLNTMAFADQAALIPVCQRLAPRTVAFTADTMAGVLGWISTVSTLAAALR